MLNSGGVEIQVVKIDEDVFASQAAEFELAALSAGQLEVRRLLTDFERLR